ncbi:uncharacterized protein LOC134182141 isoform X2 [Corticium candelabrum]|uniref:uncharacterized protein LOC134182141 isoform X2 n=1 Tax=Corticium candelabrum TaxID=121492 RepID=UPI002E276322|nr:uncharacterized protein LOC134182141 isoform X2 [Corticium candelabrum]
MKILCGGRVLYCQVRFFGFSTIHHIEDHIRHRRQERPSCKSSRTKVTIGNDGSPGRTERKADICFVVDESGSMWQEHDWLNDTIHQLDTILTIQNGIKVRYCLVGYGTTEHLLGEFLVTEGNASAIRAVIETLQETGQQEDGYSAMYKVFKNNGNFTFDPDAKKVIILVTDENRDDLDEMLNVDLNYMTMLQYFRNNNVTLNVVVNQLFKDKNNTINTLADEEEYVLGMNYKNQSYSQKLGCLTSPCYKVGDPWAAYAVKDGGHESTSQDYVRLALATNGSAWDLNQLRDASDAQVEAFTDAFVNVKVKEIVVCRVCECPDPFGEPVCTLDETLPLEQCVTAKECSINGKKVPEGGYVFKTFIPESSGSFPSVAAVDIIFVIDESGSMESDHDWLNNYFIKRTDQFLKQHYQIGMSPSPPNKFGLLVFASHDRKPDNMGKVLVTSVTAEDFPNVELHRNGKTEDGYEAIKLAADYLRQPKRSPSPVPEPRVLKLIVLVTDEDRDNVKKTLTKETLKKHLDDNNICLDVVVTNSFELEDGREAIGVGTSRDKYPAFVLRHGDDPLPKNGRSVIESGHVKTFDDYVKLAWDRNGVAWDINVVKTLTADSDDKDFGMDFTKYFSKRIRDVQCGLRNTEPPRCSWSSCRSAFPMVVCDGHIDDNYNITKEQCMSGVTNYQEHEDCPSPLGEPQPDVPDSQRKSLPTDQTSAISNRNTHWSKVCAKGAVELSSTSKLSFSNETFQRSKKHVVTFCFRTSDSDGVLLWIKQRLPEPAHILIQVVSGRVQARVNLGAGSKVLTHNLVVSDSQWHKIMFRRKGNRIELRLDGNRRPKLIAGENYDQTLTFRANNKWYLGMANSNDINDVAVPLTGCISKVKVNKKKVELEADAIEKVDVFPCE